MTNKEFAVKMLENTNGERIGGYLVVFGSERQRDLEGEFFTPETNYYLDYYDRRPILYHHGADGVWKSVAVGFIDKLKIDKTGIWAEGQLGIKNVDLWEKDQIETHKRYVESVRRLVSKKVLNWSSGALPHLVKVDKSGKIIDWGIVEGSLTPTPAEPRMTDVSILESAYKSIGLDTEKIFNGNSLTVISKPVMFFEEETAETSVNDQTPIIINSGVKKMPLAKLDAGAPVGVMKSLLIELGLFEEGLDDKAYIKAKEDFKTVISAKMEGDEVELDDAEVKMEVPSVLEALGLPSDATREDVMAMVDSLFAEEEDMDMEGDALEGEGKSVILFDHNKLALARERSKARNKQEGGVIIPVARGGKKSRSMTQLMRRGSNTPKPDIKSMLQDLREGKSVSYEQGATGGYILNHEIADEFIPALRDKLPLLEMGIDEVPMDGIETMTLMKDGTEPDAYWVGEGTTIPQSSETVGGIMLVPKPLAVRIPIPNKYLTNSRINYESRIREKITYAINRAIMIACLRGDGGVTGTNTGASPVGVLNLPNIVNTQLDTNGRKPTLEDLNDAIGLVEDANVEEDDSWGWLMAPRTKRRFTAMKDGDGLPIMGHGWGDRAGEFLYGIPYKTSNVVLRNRTVGTNSDCSNIYFGRWSSLAVGLSNQVEFMIDPYSLASSLQTQIIAHIYADVRSKYDEAFTVISGVR